MKCPVCCEGNLSNFFFVKFFTKHSKNSQECTTGDARCPVVPLLGSMFYRFSFTLLRIIFENAQTYFKNLAV